MKSYQKSREFLSQLVIFERNDKLPTGREPRTVNDTLERFVILHLVTKKI